MKQVFLIMIGILIALSMAQTENPPKPRKNLEHAKTNYWIKTADIKDSYFHQTNFDLKDYNKGIIKAKIDGKWQMTDPGVSIVFLDFPSYELRCINQLIHPKDPKLSQYEKNVVEYINRIHDYFHGESPYQSIGVIYHVIEVFDNTPGRARGKRVVPSLP